VSPSIFGVRLDRVLTRQELENTCERFLAGERVHCIFTPNPEILVQARSDPSYAALLNTADLLLPDGVGILLVQSLRRQVPVRRWPGTDSAEVILDLMARNAGTVLLLGGRAEVATTAAERLRQKWPGLRIETAGEGVPFGPEGMAVSPDDEALVGRRIEEVKPQVVLVGLGAPKQERWIERHAGSFPSVRLMMGLGGAMDMWAGRLPRAPKTVRSLGLEWLWRLALQPRRLPRVIRATVVFPLRALSEGTGR